jgi:hypothetical protein
MDLVEDFAEPGVSVVAACTALGLVRASVYRATEPPRPPTFTVRAPSPRSLDDAERRAIVDVMHTPEFLDQPPMEVYAKLLSRGVYLASIRTIYRVLAAGERCGLDRMLKANTSKERTISLYSQGLYWYLVNSVFREDRLVLLMTAYADGLKEHAIFCELFGII